MAWPVSTRVGLSVIQRNIRKWLALRNWMWWKLYCKVKPLLNIARAEDDMKKKEEELAKTKQELEKTEKMRKELEEQNVTLLQAKNDLYLQLQAEQVGGCDGWFGQRYSVGWLVACLLIVQAMR